MDTNVATAHQARRLLLILGAVLLGAILTSLYFDLRTLNTQYQGLAAEMSRSFFQAIDAMRDWNLRQGGIYVRASDAVPPSPYLEESLRSVLTTQGERMTLISHAHMTRLISELLATRQGIHLRIASLKPVRPSNEADAWERHALNHFAQGSSEEYDVIGKGEAAEFRYMAPLRMNRSCQSCHSETQDPETVRGGISVSFSYSPFLAVLAGERRRTVLLHTVFLGLGLAVIAFTGRKLVQSIEALRNSLLHIKRLEGLLPICAHCKKIRLPDSDRTSPDSWVAIEMYIADRTDAQFTHGLCPTCAKQLYPDYFRREKPDK